MYIPKRWLIPGMLSLILGVMIVMNLLNTFGEDETTLRQQLASATQPATGLLATQTPAQPAEYCATTAADERAFAAYLDAVHQAELDRVVFEDFATNSGIIYDSQFNDGGFGDVGMQWRDVAVNGPVVTQHVSGNGNTTVSNVNSNNTVNVVVDGGTPPAPVVAPAPSPTPEPVVAPNPVEPPPPVDVTPPAPPAPDVPPALTPPPVSPGTT